MHLKKACCMHDVTNSIPVLGTIHILRKHLKEGKGGGVRKCQFLLILSTEINAYVGGEGGPEILKMCLHNI